MHYRPMKRGKEVHQQERPLFYQQIKIRTSTGSYAENSLKKEKHIANAKLPRKDV